MYGGVTILEVVFVLINADLIFSEGEASVTFDSDQTSVSEDAGSTQVCASLSLTSGFTLETMVIADFEVDPGDTGTYYNTSSSG